MPNYLTKAIFFLIVFIFPSLLLADPIYYSSYNPTVPIGTQVALRSGMVNIRVFLDNNPPGHGNSPDLVARFDCVFNLQNTGRTEKMLVGFPIPLHPEHFNLSLPDNVDQLLYDPNLAYVSFGAFDFRVTSDNIPLKVITYAEATTGLTVWPIPTPYDEVPSYSRHFGWRFWKMDIDKKESKELKVSYAMRLYGKKLMYIVDTGASWKGMINDFIIRIDPGPFGQDDWDSIEPAGFNWEEGIIIWHFKNFEPVKKHNLRLVVKDDSFKRLKEPLENQGTKTP